MALITQNASELITKMNEAVHHHYTLMINGVTPQTLLSVLAIDGHELLNQPWRYEVTFTSPDKHIRVSSVLTQPASFSFKPHSVSDMLRHISSLDTPAMPRTLYGVVTEFSQLSVNKDEAHYRVVLTPRLALLANDCTSAIYQNQSVVSVVETVLRRHGFTGVDYRLELKETYPAREFITAVARE